jgi:hypothetical protein
MVQAIDTTRRSVTSLEAAHVATTSFAQGPWPALSLSDKNAKLSGCRGPTLLAELSEPVDLKRLSRPEFA